MELFMYFQYNYILWISSEVFGLIEGLCCSIFRLLGMALLARQILCMVRLFFGHLA